LTPHCGFKHAPYGAFRPRRRGFNLYIIRLGDYRSSVLNSEQWKAMQGSEVDHHAGEVETSAMLDVRPELVKMLDIGEPGLPRKRLAHLGVLTPMRWYADYPDHYAGDARSATAEKGRFLMDGFVAQAAELFKRIKNDQVAPDLEREYFRQSGL
jgi:creatinine amidohydrolase